MDVAAGAEVVAAAAEVVTAAAEEVAAAAVDDDEAADEEPPFPGSVPLGWLYGAGTLLGTWGATSFPLKAGVPS